MLPSEPRGANADSEREPSGSRANESAPPQNTRTISSTELFQENREVWIQHGQEIYRLRLTKNGKLILHK